MGFNSKDSVKHKSLGLTMQVVAIEGSWVICEYTDENGERVKKTYNEECLVILQKVRRQNINPDHLDLI